MHAPNKKKLIAATAAPFALTIALGTAPAFATNGGNGNGNGNGSAAGTANTSTASASSEATIRLDGCTVNSDKEISYIEYSLGGSVVAKDESIGSTTYDLTQVTFDFDSISVKAGTTVTALGGAGCDTAPEVVEKEDNSTGGGTEGGTENDGHQNGGGDVDTDTNTDDNTDAETEADADAEVEVDDENDDDAKNDEKNDNKADDEKADDEDEVAVGGNAGGGIDTEAGGDVAAGGEVKAGADVAAGTDVKADADVAAAGQVAGLEANASAGTTDVAGAGDQVLGAQAPADTAPAYQSAAGESTGILPNTGAGENAALVAGGAALVGLGGLLMLARRRLGFNS